MDPAQYPFVSFAAYVTEDSVSTAVAIYKDKNTGPPVLLHQIAPDFKIREWRRYVVPVAKLNPSGQRITGIQIQTLKATGQPLVYIDSIAFLRGAPSATAPSKSSEIDAYRARWTQAAAKASARD
jgi:hypothetical protein